MAVFVAGLITSAIVLGCVAGPVIDRSRWPTAYPGTAAICWLGALAGTVAALSSLIVLSLLAPPAPAHGLLEWFHKCLPRHEHEMLIEGSVVSIVLVALCCARLARGVPRLWRAVFHRRRHREMLRIVADEDERHTDLLIVDHPVPVAYSLPTRRRPIVISTGAQARLDADELAAVLAHERTHVRQRHHLLLLLLDLAGVLLPWLPTVRRARRGLPPLLEMAADDAAARRCGRGALAAALLRLGAGPSPAGTLAAAEAKPAALARRLARLDTAAMSTHRGATVLAWITAICAIAGPPALAALALAAIPLPC